MRRTRFGDLSLTDPFFASFKDDYPEFPRWFTRKRDESAWVMQRNDQLVAFLYTKIEEGPVNDVDPPMPMARRLKVGSFKVDAHGTRLGERLIKKCLDEAISAGVTQVYVTIFKRHASLVSLLTRYGFVVTGTKPHEPESELVLTKYITEVSGDIIKDYPLIVAKGHRAYLLAIYPQYHSEMFPESILNNESVDILTDCSHTNSIHKIYVCSMDLAGLLPGDILVMYRTTDRQGPARFRSVATSLCVVEDVRPKSDFPDASAFAAYCSDYSVFSSQKLKQLWLNRKRLYAVRMTYNAALRHRLTRMHLMDAVNIDDSVHWDFVRLTSGQLHRIAKDGDISDSIIVY